MARSMLDLTHPDLDFVALAQGMGVPAERPTDGEGLVDGAAPGHRRARTAPGRGRDPLRLLIRAGSAAADLRRRRSRGSVSRLRWRFTIRHSSPESVRSMNPGWCSPRWIRPNAVDVLVDHESEVDVARGDASRACRRRARRSDGTTLEDQRVHDALSGVGPGRAFTTWSRSGNATIVAFGNRLYCCMFMICAVDSRLRSTPARGGGGAGPGRRGRPGASGPGGTAGTGPGGASIGKPMRVPITVTNASKISWSVRTVTQARARQAVRLLELAVPGPTAAGAS